MIFGAALYRVTNRAEGTALLANSMGEMQYDDEMHMFTPPPKPSQDSLFDRFIEHTENDASIVSAQLRALESRGIASPLSETRSPNINLPPMDIWTSPEQAAQPGFSLYADFSSPPSSRLSPLYTHVDNRLLPTKSAATAAAVSIASGVLVDAPASAGLSTHAPLAAGGNTKTAAPASTLNIFGRHPDAPTAAEDEDLDFDVLVQHLKSGGGGDCGGDGGNGGSSGGTAGLAGGSSVAIATQHDPDSIHDSPGSAGLSITNFNNPTNGRPRTVWSPGYEFLPQLQMNEEMPRAQNADLNRGDQQATDVHTPGYKSTIDSIPETCAGGGASNAESLNREPAFVWDSSTEPVLTSPRGRRGSTHSFFTFFREDTLDIAREVDAIDTVRSTTGDDPEEAFLGDGNASLNNPI